MINIGIIGCGKIAKRHASVLANGVEGLNLAAVCDIDLEKASYLGALFNVPAYQTADEMMAKSSIDVFAILTPSGLHSNIFYSLLHYGKDYIIEKPITLLLDDAENMLKTADKNGIKIFEVKQNRYNMPIRLLYKCVVEKKFNNIFLGAIRLRWSRNDDYYRSASWRGSWEFDGGVLANQAIHFIDLLLWLMGDVHSVFAYSMRASASIEAEDTLVAVLKFESGAIGTIEATTAIRPKNLGASISILGSGGSFEVGGMNADKIINCTFEDESAIGKEVIKEYASNPPNFENFGHSKFYENFLTSYLNKTPFGVDPIPSLKLIHAIYDSIESNQEILIKGYKQKFSKLGVKS